jgi:hypothetical protein
MNAQEQKGDDPELPEVDASKMPSPSSVEEAAGETRHLGSFDSFVVRRSFK